jgi:carboxyl-terminal processing protease
MYIKKIRTIFVALALSLIFINNCIADVVSDSNSTDPNNITIPVDDVNNFAKVYAITKSYYVESVADSKLMKGAINGMLSNLDPHSAYLDKDDFKQLNELTTGEFAGIGIEISRDSKSDGIKVIAPLDGTPAYLSGIKSGDTITKIDNIPVSSMTLDDAVKKMRGKVGTKVTLTIVRAGELTPIVKTLTRATIAIKSVKYNMLESNYAYVRITDFQEDTTTNLVKILNIINQKDKNLKGLILDLRDNPGGLLQSAVGVVGAFIPANSLVVYTSGRAPNSNNKFYARVKDYSFDDSGVDILKDVPVKFKTIPMVVLVNQGTASAAEIVSGALQDYKRAKIVGTNTFGKGSVQTVIPLSADTAVKLTTALYYTPNGRSIQAKGIKPDIIVKSEYSDILDSWDVSEAGLNNHLSNPNKLNVVMDKDNTPVITPPKQIKSQSDLKKLWQQQTKLQPKVVSQDIAVVSLPNDFQLQWALKIVEGKPLPFKSEKTNAGPKAK